MKFSTLFKLALSILCKYLLCWGRRRGALRLAEWSRFVRKFWSPDQDPWTEQRAVHFSSPSNTICMHTMNRTLGGTHKLRWQDFAHYWPPTHPLFSVPPKWVWGHGDLSQPSFGSYLNSISTMGGRLCPPYTDVLTQFWNHWRACTLSCQRSLWTPLCFTLYAKEVAMPTEKTFF